MARRSRKSDAPNAVVASARKVKLGSPGVKLELGLDQAWQKEAWEYWRKVPEIKQLMLFLGNQLAKLRLFVAVDDPNDPEGDPIPIGAPEANVPPRIIEAVNAELARLDLHEGGVGELLRRLDLNLEIPGEGYLVGYGAREIGDPDPFSPSLDKLLDHTLDEAWVLTSKSTLIQSGSGALARTAVKQHPGDQQGRRLDKEHDTIIRLYQADPEWPALADSAMQGVLFDARILMALTSQVLAVANSQMHAGILTVPNELSFGPAEPAKDDDDATPSEDPLDRELDDVFSEVVEMPDSLMTIRPTLLRGPGQYLSDQYVRYIKMGRELDERLDLQIEQRVRRLARGLNAPVEAVEGSMQTTFANAKQIDRDLFDDHIEPRATGIMAGLTDGFLRPNLIDAASEPVEQGSEETRIVDQELADWAGLVYIWYDAAAAIREPDTETAADKAHELGTISDAAHRRAKGFSEDDAAEPLELLIRHGMRRGTLDPALTRALLQELADEAGIELPEAAAIAPASPDAGMQALGAALLLRERIRLAGGDEPGAAPIVIPATSSELAGAAQMHGPNPGADLLAIDTELRTRLLVAASDAMERALERAGNRLRSRVASAQRPLIEGLPARMFAAALGRGVVTAAVPDQSELIEHEWEGLGEQFDVWVAGAQASAVEQLELIVGDLGEQRATIEARQEEDRSDAWAWFAAALTTLMGSRLYDPSPDAPTIGEHDLTLAVPTSTVRAALARAGGADGASLDGVGAVLVDGGTRPAGGIGTGQLIQQQLRDFGASIKAYRWVYGPALRSTFIPHAQLDGTVFTSYDDPRLVNGAGFPPFSNYMPGDHFGCRCDVELVIVPPAGLVPLV